MRYGLFGKSIGIERMVLAVEVAVLDALEKNIAINKLCLAGVLLPKGIGYLLICTVSHSVL